MAIQVERFPPINIIENNLDAKLHSSIQLEQPSVDIPLLSIRPTDVVENKSIFCGLCLNDFSQLRRAQRCGGDI